jgi:hypothetical protein
MLAEKGHTITLATAANPQLSRSPDVAIRPFAPNRSPDFDTPYESGSMLATGCLSRTYMLLPDKE